MKNVPSVKNHNMGYCDKYGKVIKAVTVLVTAAATNTTTNLETITKRSCAYSEVFF